MKAAVFHGAGKKLSVENVADPTPENRQVVVKVQSCGICGTDLTMTSGHGVMHWQPGDIPGHEYSGEVIALGPGVERLVVGDRVSQMAIWSACGRCESCRSGNEAWCTGTDHSLGCAFGSRNMPWSGKLRRSNFTTVCPSTTGPWSNPPP